jgi:hypothetical protein
VLLRSSHPRARLGSKRPLQVLYCKTTLATPAFSVPVLLLVPFDLNYKAYWLISAV